MGLLLIQGRAWLLCSLKESVLEKENRLSIEVPDPLTMAPAHTTLLQECCGAPSRLSRPCAFSSCARRSIYLKSFESALPQLEMVGLLDVVITCANCGGASLEATTAEAYRKDTGNDGIGPDWKNGLILAQWCSITTWGSTRSKTSIRCTMLQTRRSGRLRDVGFVAKVLRQILLKQYVLDGYSV